MTALVALGPVVASPVLAWLLMEFGPERSVLLMAYWVVASIAFAIVVPVMRRRGRSLARATVLGTLWSVGITAVVFVTLLFAFTPRVGAVTVSVDLPARVASGRDTVRP